MAVIEWPWGPSYAAISGGNTQFVGLPEMSQ